MRDIVGQAIIIEVLCEKWSVGLMMALVNLVNVEIRNEPVAVEGSPLAIKVKLINILNDYYKVATSRTLADQKARKR